MSLVSAVFTNASGDLINVDVPEVPPISTEAEVILLCSRRADLSEAERARISSRLSGPLDIDALFGLAYKHGVLPLVCHKLLQNFSSDLTPDAREAAGEFCRHHAMRNVSMTGKLVEILRALETAGIPAVPFKGPTLSMQVYKSIALRQFIDLDILVMPKHFDRAVKLLLDSGYELHSNGAASIPGAFRINRRKDVSLVRPDDKIRVELHWKLSGSYFAMPLQLNRLWTRMDKSILGGVPVSTLPFNDLFVYLCLHAARHGFERLEWICDINELILNETNADWESIRKHARVHGCEKVLELALFLVYDLFGTRPEYPEFGRIARDKLLMKTAVLIRRRLFTEPAGSNEIGDWYVYHLMLKEKRRDRVKLHLFYLAWYLKLLFRPNSADKTVFGLPSSFYPLYFVLRPARLIFNYFSNQTSKR